MWAWARLQAGNGQNPVYYYSFRQKPPFPTGSVYEGWGASHFSELWYVFDHLNQEPWRWGDADRNMAEEMSSYWINFAKSAIRMVLSFPCGLRSRKQIAKFNI
jgi:para-nitrobenzyl esterase